MSGRGIPPTIRWSEGAVELIDQRLLPETLSIVRAESVDELCEYIRELAIRGAPALGAAGAFGIALAWATGADLDEAAIALVATRPTAVNLAWGVERARRSTDPLVEALAVAAEDVERCHSIGRWGGALLPDVGAVLTHCNAGHLACVEYGTALGVIRGGVALGKDLRVWVDETRPVLQGARLTAWELDRDGISATLIPDVAAAGLMARGEVDAVVVGADRIAANGDVANKVGTYGLAVLAERHGVPFYVAAPTSTIDPECPDGAGIPIEIRSPDEVAIIGNRRMTPRTVSSYNPAFDVTPAALVTAWITEVGVSRSAADLPVGG